MGRDRRRAQIWGRKNGQYRVTYFPLFDDPAPRPSLSVNRRFAEAVVVSLVKEFVSTQPEQIRCTRLSPSGPSISPQTPSSRLPHPRRQKWPSGGSSVRPGRVHNEPPAQGIVCPYCSSCTPVAGTPSTPPLYNVGVKKTLRRHWTMLHANSVERMSTPFGFAMYQQYIV